MVSIGGKIKKLRTERHMTQMEFAERLGVTKSAISSYENGSRLPSYDILLKMARIFKISTDMLLGNADDNRVTLDVTGLNRTDSVVGGANRRLEEGECVAEEILYQRKTRKRLKAVKFLN